MKIIFAFVLPFLFCLCSEFAHAQKTSFQKLQMQFRRDRLTEQLLRFGYYIKENNGRLFAQGSHRMWDQIFTTLGQMDKEEIAYLARSPMDLGLKGQDEFLSLAFRELVQMERMVSDADKIVDLFFPSYDPDSFLQLSRMKNSRNARQFDEIFALYLNEADGKIDKSMEDFFSGNEIEIKPESFKIFFNLLMKEYVKRLTPTSRGAILYRFLKLPETATDFDKFSIVVDESGPRLQKLLQMISRKKELSPEFAERLKSLESNIKYDHSLGVQVQVSRALGTLEGGPEVYLSTLPIGSGTMAQTHTSDYQDHAAAVRVNKPGVEQVLADEWYIFRDITSIIENDPGLKGTIFEHFGKLVDQVSVAIMNELDVQKFAAAQRTAKVVYAEVPSLQKYGSGQAVEILVPEIYFVSDRRYGVVIMQLVDGMSADEYFKIHPELKKAVMENIAERWTREAFFGSGFFHADLHQGNLKFKLLDHHRTQATLLDYGLNGTLSDREQKGILRLSAALAENRVKTAMTILKDELGVKTGSILTERFQQLIVDGCKERLELQPFLERLVSEGADLSDVLIDFNRGMLLVDQLLEGAGSTMKVAALAKKMGNYLILKDLKATLNPLVRTAEKHTPFKPGELIQFSCARVMNRFLP